EIKHAQQQIIHNSLHDALTNLPNRKLLFERLELAINRAQVMDNYSYAVLFIDLDRFKVINDSLGHLVGDQLLIAVAQRITSHLRKTDLVARLGGDEFVILLEEISATEEVIHIAERITADCQTPVEINGHKIFTGLSIGIVMGKEEYQEAGDLIRNADTAMYKAKAQRSNSYRFFDAHMHTEALNRLTLEAEIRKALEREEFVVYYQPVFELHSNCLVGFEALVRWHHPTRGIVFPGEFIAIAEETGLIVQLDQWIFHQACRQMVTWQHRYPHHQPLKVSINLSAQDLRQNNLMKDIDAILSQTHLAGELLILEITEGMLIEDINRTIELFAQLEAKNIRISVDDFGTGYSSLSYLHRLPVHSLKIDRSFVGQMRIHNRNYQIVSTIITLGNQLGLTVVAEGIETPQQQQQLKQLGCQLGQGHLFSESLTPQEIETRFFQL
ncbi:MAG: EAL domain-containing protein, partial [Okeania sp. SIO2D1]|nr:EAL domain-containing protein [Okeania sp. SIO2D1]